MIVGLVIRLKLMESPAFERVKETKTEADEPIVDVVRKYPREVLTAMGMRMGENGVFYLLTVFVLRLRRGGAGPRARTRCSPAWSSPPRIGLFTVPLWGALSDRVGRKPLYLAGAIITTLWAFPLLRADGHEVAGADLAGRRGRRQHRARPHVRAAGRVLLRAVRHPRALQRRVARLPARVGVRGRLRAADRDRAAGRRGGSDARRAVHHGAGRDLGGRDAVRARDVPARTSTRTSSEERELVREKRFDRERFATGRPPERGDVTSRSSRSRRLRSSTAAARRATPAGSWSASA